MLSKSKTNELCVYFGLPIKRALLMSIHAVTARLLGRAAHAVTARLLGRAAHAVTAHSYSPLAWTRDPGGK